MMSRCIPAILLLASASLVAQTTNVAGTNQMTVNGTGAGGTSCITYENYNGGSALTMDHAALANSPIITVLAAACTPNAIALPGGYSVDIDLNSAQFLLDGTGIFVPSNVLTPYLTTGATGNAPITIPNLNTFAVSLQSAYVNPAFAAGLGLSAAFNVRWGLQGVCNSPAVVLGDDSSVNMPTAGFILYGGFYSDCYVNSNGNVTFGAPNTDFSESVSEFLSGPARIAMFWDDFNPNAGGTVTYFDNGIGQAGVCFTGVPEFNTSNSNNFSVLWTNANIIFAYGNMASIDGIVGVSPGNNLDTTGTALDITAAAAASTPLTGGTAAYYELFDANNPRDFGFGYKFEIGLSGGTPTLIYN